MEQIFPPAGWLYHGGSTREQLRGVVAQYEPDEYGPLHHGSGVCREGYAVAWGDMEQSGEGVYRGQAEAFSAPSGGDSGRAGPWNGLCEESAAQPPEACCRGAGHGEDR